MVDGLPESLRQLVAAAEWEGVGQLRDVRIPVEVAQRWDPDSPWINLWTPFKLSDEVARNRAFWDEFGALSMIDTDDYAIIGDFGPGSDSPKFARLRTNDGGADLYGYDTLASGFMVN